MLETVLSSGTDTLLVAIPSFAFLLICMFRLERLFMAPKKGVRAERAPCGQDTDGQVILTDPDGRPSGRVKLRGVRETSSTQ